jgi:predicted membrane-bound dolichyl-phosphate-mannose-protein mannosyltransferase
MAPTTIRVDRSRRRRLLLSKIHVGLAAIGTLSAVLGIGIAIYGGLEFNRTKVFVGVGVIVVSTILYVSMLFVPDEPEA